MVYPHTSNWNFAWGMRFRLGYGLPVHWLAKHSLFRWPVGGPLKKLGGSPVDRRAPRGTIRAIADEFHRRDELWPDITPKSMRAYTDHWKSGRYQIALVAGVPCGLGYIDDGQKTLGIEIFLTFTGDAAADMERLAAFYADNRGCRQEQASEIRLLNSGASRPGGRGRAPFESPGG